MFDYFILTGVELNKWTLALTFSLWSLPSVQLGAVLSRNTAAKYETIFEIIYSIEVKSTTWNGYFKCFVDILDCHRNCAVVSTNLDSLECRAASSKCMCLIKEREKLAIDYQLRVIFVVCIVQSLILFVTRPALVYAQLCGWKDTPCLLPIAIARIQSFVFYSVIMSGIAVERLVATLFWEWYEKQRTSTLFVVAAVFGVISVIVIFNTLSIAGLHFTDNVFAMKTVASPLAGAIALTSCMIYAVLLAFNKYELRRMHKGKVDAYSLACTYQLRENVMIIRIMGPAFVISTPAFAFRGLHLFLPHTPEFEFTRSLAAAMFDLWISLVSVFMSFIFPLFNVRFRKPAKRFFIYRQIMRCFRCKAKSRIRASAQKEIADVYFESFNRAMTTSPRTPNISSISFHIKIHNT
ncbi:hypothetical protein PRIPAC_80721 [Pristionchus pacificus]|uniref:G protein-coupled receptor n=1 Tax=Pristionchus pacificus TaxID=54126 RepID=A0A2A6CP13_PRIPA|nr:hypothetical protein PRIPAC_80721 [Pristionchus pacificus]|eukprot:PDM79838.1 G protein-coupled receptor [Pristionchus pacificus]